MYSSNPELKLRSIQEEFYFIGMKLQAFFQWFASLAHILKIFRRSEILSISPSVD